MCRVRYYLTNDSIINTMSITTVNTSLNARVNRSISLTYLQSILFCAGLYLMFFMGVFLSSALLGVIPLPPMLFLVLYCVGVTILQNTIVRKRNPHPQDMGWYNTVSFGLAGLVAYQLGGMLSVFPIAIGYFCISLYASVFVAGIMVQFRDTLIPQFTSGFIWQSFCIIATNCATWYLAGVFMQASLPMMYLGLSIASSYVSTMYLLMTLKMAIIDTYSHDISPAASFYGFLIFNNTLSLAMNFMQLFMLSKQNNQRRGSNSADSIGAIFRVLTILLDVFTLHLLSKRLDEVYIQRQNSYQNYQLRSPKNYPNHTKSVRFNFLSKNSRVESVEFSRSGSVAYDQQTADPRVFTGSDYR